MRNKLIFAVFAVLVVFQLATPLAMIMNRERVLKYGLQFRFKTAPVDPYDAFRGRYVALNIPADKVPVPGGVQLAYGQPVYGQITVDEQGYARISKITLQKPRWVVYLTARVGYQNGNEVSLKLPIDRYFMEEHAAARAEQVYRKFSQRDKQEASVLVRILDGSAVIEGLYIGGRRMEEMIEKTGTH